MKKFVKPDWACTPFELNRRLRKRVKSPYGTIPGEAEILEKIMEMHRKGFPPGFIATELMCHRIKPRGKRWQETSIKRIIERVERESRHAQAGQL